MEPMSKEIEKLDQSLLTLKDVSTKFEEMLVNKKNERILLSGAMSSAKESQENFNSFMTKSKDELAEEVKKGQVSEAVAKYVWVWLQKSQEVLKKFTLDKTAQLNVKLGELSALDNSVKLLKLQQDMYSLKKDEVEKQNLLQLLTPVEEKIESFVAPTTTNLEEAEDKKTKKGRKPRPDEIGPLSKTVQRLKENRKKKTAK
jgi:hypothetical protein